jgi:hypothetical protein
VIFPYIDQIRPLILFLITPPSFKIILMGFIILCSYMHMTYLDHIHSPFHTHVIFF